MKNRRSQALGKRNAQKGIYELLKNVKEEEHKLQNGKNMQDNKK